MTGWFCKNRAVCSTSCYLFYSYSLCMCMQKHLYDQICVHTHIHAYGGEGTLSIPEKDAIYLSFSRRYLLQVGDSSRYLPVFGYRIAKVCVCFRLLFKHGLGSIVTVLFCKTSTLLPEVSFQPCLHDSLSMTH